MGQLNIRSEVTTVDTLGQLVCVYILLLLARERAPPMKLDVASFYAFTQYKQGGYLGRCQSFMVRVGTCCKWGNTNQGVHSSLAYVCLAPSPAARCVCTTAKTHAVVDECKLFHHREAILRYRIPVNVDSTPGEVLE